MMIRSRRVAVPTVIFLEIACVLGAVSIAVPLLPLVIPIWSSLLVLSGILVLLDVSTRPARGSVTVSRRLEPLYHVGREASYRLLVRNASPIPLDVEIRETLPPELDGDDLRESFRLEPGEEVWREIRFVGMKRGTHALLPLGVRIWRPLALLSYQETLALDDATVIAPGRPAGETEWLLSRVAALTEQGQRRTRKRGMDREFDSLRDYVVGDEVRRIDWKASARRFRPLVRQYQLERNSEVILALDCGRLMGSLIDGVSKLDLVMTPVLDVAAVALRGQERVGFLAFDSKPLAFLPPRNGLQQLGAIRTAMATLPEANDPTSYLRAVRYLEARHRKRSLIIFVTDFTDEISAREMHATLTALTRRHVMIFVAVNDPHLERVFSGSKYDLPSVFEKAVAGQLILERRRTLVELERVGVLTVDAHPMRLSGRLVSRYLEVKLRGLL